MSRDTHDFFKLILRVWKNLKHCLSPFSKFSSFPQWKSTCTLQQILLLVNFVCNVFFSFSILDFFISVRVYDWRTTTNTLCTLNHIEKCRNIVSRHPTVDKPSSLTIPSLFLADHSTFSCTSDVQKRYARTN